MHGCLCNACVQCQWMPEEEVRPSTFYFYETSIIWEFRLPWIGNKINQAAGSLVRTAPRSDHGTECHGTKSPMVPSVSRETEWKRHWWADMPLHPCIPFHYDSSAIFFSFQEMFFHFPQFLPRLFLFSFLLSCSLWPCWELNLRPCTS